MKLQRDLLVLLGAIGGGVLGHYGFIWLAGQNFYAMILPGGMVGLGAGLTKHGTLPLAIVCGLIALVCGLISEWRAFPFIADESLSYFLLHIFQLKPLTLIMLAVGAVLGFWFPYRRSQEPIAHIPPAESR